MKIKVASMLLGMSLAATSFGQWEDPWCDDDYCDDNGSNGHRQEPELDVYDTPNASGQISGDKMYVDIGTEQVTSYARICEYIAGVKLRNSSNTILTEKEYLNAQVVRANRDKQYQVPFELADSPGFKFIQDSIIMHSTCLRYKGEGTPNPFQNPDDRPGQMPHDVCNPDLDMEQGCGNDQRSDGTDEDPWPNSDDWWE